MHVGRLLLPLPEAVDDADHRCFPDLAVALHVPDRAGDIAFDVALQTFVERAFGVVLVVQEHVADRAQRIGDITKRRGQIRDQEERANAIVVRAFVPLSEMFGYSTDLRSFTQGRGNYVMQMDHYSEVPKSIAEKIAKKNASAE